jgi:hypothetical protein
MPYIRRKNNILKLNGDTMIIAFLALASVTSTSLPAISTDMEDWVLPLYGEEMQFDVKRNGKKIGEHFVTFKQENDTLIVKAGTKIRVKFLFITAYKFDYKAEETWQGNKLKTLTAYTNDNGDVSEVNYSYNDESSPLFSTNHWNPNVLEADHVLNTITGKTNDVTISKMGWENLSIQDKTLSALRHEYSGDLKDVTTWYDEQGRWVGLQFKGNDDSIISYECNLCGI